MQAQRRVHYLERGSVASFIIVGLVMVGLLVGGVVAVKNRASQIAQSSPQITRDAVQGGDKSDNQTSSGADTGTKEDSSALSTPETVTSGSASASQVLSEPIAATGPTEILSNMVVLGVVVIATTRYFQSRGRVVRQ